MAFSIEEKDYDRVYEKLVLLNVNIIPGRQRDTKDKKSIYFTDRDGHKFEFHTGTLFDRTSYYNEEGKNIWDFTYKKEAVS